MGLSDGERISMIRSAVLIQYTRVSGRRTELAWHIRAIAYMLHVARKNDNFRHHFHNNAPYPANPTNIGITFRYHHKLESLRYISAGTYCHSRSSEVIDFGTNRKRVYRFVMLGSAERGKAKLPIDR